MKMPFIAALLIALFTPALAHVDKTKEQWTQEAQEEAEKLFRSYHAVCNGNVIARKGASSYLEFSGPSADVTVFGLYRVSEADKLNGLLWSGKVVAAMGTSSRSISVTEEGIRKVSEWVRAREAEFDFTYTGGEWRLNGKIYSPDWFLQPHVTCEFMYPISRNTPVVR
jgi:hypothetical protein